MRPQRGGITRFWAAAAAGVLVLGLAGCGGDDNTVTPTGNPSVVSEAPAPTPSVPVKPTAIEPPEKPAAMATADEDGAVAAAEYFLRMTTYAAATGDTAELEAMSGPDCQFCASYLESVANLHDPEVGEAWTTMPTLEIEFADAKPTAEASQFQVNMRTDKSSYEYFDEADGLQEAAAEALVMVVVVTYSSNDSWIVEAAQDFPSDTEIPGENR